MGNNIIISFICILTVVIKKVMHISPLQNTYNEGRNSIGRAILVEFLIENGIRGLHRTNSMAIHVEIILRVDETYPSFLAISSHYQHYRHST